MTKLETLAELLHELKKSNLFLVIVALITGYLLSNALIEQPEVGIIRITGVVLKNENSIDTTAAQTIVDMLRYAEENSRIKAVVLDIDSPGGLASASEEVYLGVLKLRKEKPVVASIESMGASGAYYIAIASNFIYAKPTSIVGSVGVISKLPKPEGIDESTITSGPFKDVGSPSREWAYQSKMAAQSFHQAVLLQRKDKLKMSGEELARGEIYIGTVGHRLGLVDGIGSTSDAIEKAASYAGIANYRVVELSISTNATALSPFRVNESLLESPTNTAPVNYYLYIGAER